MTTPISGPLKFGAQARLTREVQDLSDGRTWRARTEFVVEDFVSAEESEDGQAFYYGNINGGLNNLCVIAEAVEQVRSAEEMAARKPPTPAEVAYGLHVLTDHDLGTDSGWEADESEPMDNTLTVYGTTEDGLRICVRLVVAEVFEVDL